MANKRLDFQQSGDVNIIRMEGEMTFFFLEELNNYIKGQLAENRFKFVYEMSQVTWIDSIGLGVIATTIKFALLNDQRVVIVGAKDNVRKLLEMSSLLELVVVCSTIDDAVEYFAGGREPS